MDKTRQPSNGAGSLRFGEKLRSRVALSTAPVDKVLEKSVTEPLQPSAGAGQAGFGDKSANAFKVLQTSIKSD